LVQALRYAKGKQVNIYTDSKYAFATLHMHGAIYKERGLLTAGGKEIKNKEEILQLLEAVWEPSHVAVMHCRDHQMGTDNVSRGTAWLTRQQGGQQKS
jgi:ribonuclease HI